jgi:hypothetical protein
VGAILALAFIMFLIYCYIKFWAWLGGTIGKAIGREIDKRIAHRYQDQRNDSIRVTICSERSSYFDDVLEDIQRKKRPNNG